jgi:PmbA protein
MSPIPSTEELDLLDRLLDRLPPGETGDARLVAHRFGTMRFANGRVHQPHAETERVVSLRVARGSRLAVATTTDLTPGGLAALIRSARSLAGIAPVERHFPGFSAPSGNRPKPVAFSRETARMSLDRQGRMAGAMLEAARSDWPDARVSGALHVGEELLAVANSAGVHASTRRSVAQGSLLVDRPDQDPPVSGWSEGAHWDVERLDPRRLGAEAAARVARRPPETVKPGRYRVLLDGPAFAELALWLAFLGFGGHGEAEKWSPLRRRRGKRIAPPSLTIVDDGASAETLPQGIDFEGRTKRRTPLVERGVAQAAVTDLLTSARLGGRSTGHALPPESPWGDFGPVPTQVIVAPGDASRDALIRETRRGLLVTRFHYVRVVDPGRAVITGMTRDGTYRIEGGEVVAPVRNLRFTESVLTAMARLEHLGRERRVYADERGRQAITCPAAVTGAFTFTSATLF